MQFNSYFFILFFLPVTLLWYFILGGLGKERLSKVYLLAMSLWFYGYFNISYLGIICGSIVVNYLFSRIMAREKRAGRDPRLFLVLGVVFNVSVIFYFKYFDFFLANINTLFGTDFVLRNILLPLGISFFTFQQISFMVDSYKGETQSYSFTDYALFVAFFPQLVAGPIVLHSELIPQFKDSSKHRVNFDNLSRGLILFARGLGKKILIADTFGGAVDWGFTWAARASSGQDALSFYEVIIVMLSYTFQIYFDFSGYSDMAIGLGAMFNFDIPVNFNSPYKALSVSDFWKRWHMTLTRFLTRYIYIPLGGNRKGRVRTYINVMIVFLVSGIWHGANWTFILWGVLHGAFQCVNKLFSKSWNRMMTALEESLPGKCLAYVVRACQWLVTFAVINLLWLLFRAESVTQYLQILKRLTVPYYFVREELLDFFRIPKIRYVFEALHVNIGEDVILTACVYAAMILALVLCLFVKNNHEKPVKKDRVSLLCTWGLLFVCIISMGRVSTFLYFNF